MSPRMSEAEWQRALTAYLKSEMRQKDLDFGDLARLLGEAGSPIDRVPLANKVNRGTFSAGYFLLLLSILGRQPKWLGEIAGYRPTDTENTPQSSD